MRAVRVQAYGDANQLVSEDVPVPEPKAGEVRVKVAAIGVNFVEVYQRKGLYKGQLPFTPGDEFAGTVDAVGEGVTEFRPGDRVATARGTGSYGEYAIVKTMQLVHVPDGVSLEVAAAVMLQGMTAHYLTMSTFPLEPGNTALAHAAAGGVGALLVQIAKMREARVIATAGTEEKVQIAREVGADEVILYTQQDFEAETRRLTDGKGVDVVYDGVGKATFDKGLNILKPRGYMVLYGQASGSVDPVNPQTLNQKGSLFLTRPTLRDYILTREEVLWRAGDLFRWIETGDLKVRIDKTFPLSEAKNAHQYLEDRKTKGKVLLVP